MADYAKNPSLSSEVPSSVEGKGDEKSGVWIENWASFGDSTDVSKLTTGVVDRSGVTHRSYVLTAKPFLPGLYLVEQMKWTIENNWRGHKDIEEEYCALIRHQDYDVRHLMKTRSPKIRVEHKRRYSWHEARNWGEPERKGTFFINPQYNSQVVTAEENQTEIADVYVLRTKEGVNMGYRVDTTTSTYIQGDWIGGLLISTSDGKYIGLSVSGIMSEVDDDRKIVPKHWIISY